MLNLKKTLAIFVALNIATVFAQSGGKKDEVVEESPYFNANLTCQDDTIFKVYNDAWCTDFNDTLTQKY